MQLVKNLMIPSTSKIENNFDVEDDSQPDDWFCVSVRNSI